MKVIVPAALALIAACGKGGGAIETVETFDGTATVAGAPVKITGCKVALVGDKPAVHFVLENGMTIIQSPRDGMMLQQGGGAPEALACGAIGGKWNTGSAGRKMWAYGALDTTCQHAAGAIALDVTYDCGAQDRPSSAARSKPVTS